MQLKTYMILLAGAAALSGPAVARTGRQTHLPKPPGMSDRVYATVNAKFQRYDQAARAAGATAAKTTATAQRVIAQAYSEWAGATTPTLIDSTTLRYSGTRGSKFGDYILFYNMENPGDQPGNVEYQDSYVSYDTMKYYDMTGGGNVSTSWRSYNSGNQVTASGRDQGQRKVYTYLANNKLGKVITMADQGSGLDSVQREFYSYNASGLMFKDSVESFDSSTMTWEPAVNFEFTTNAGGKITAIDLLFNLGGTVLPVMHTEYSYAANGKVSLVEMDMLDFNTFTMVPQSKDSIGYSGNTMVYENYYSADPNTGALGLVYMERRRLNAQGLVDSAAQLNPAGGSDSYLKLSYDANGYPTRVTSYNVGSTVPDNESRYYYEQNANSVPKVQTVKALSVAPNPAVNQIRLDNKLGARFRVLDLNGRLMMDGTVAPGAGIGVDALTPGLYSITLTDAAGEQFSGRFVKQ